MTMQPIYKYCPKCHKKYIWNPDVGNFDCPCCHGMGKLERSILNKIAKKKLDDISQRHI